MLVAASIAAAGVVAQPPIRVVDDTGTSVELATPARRIVSLAPHTTELLFSAGAGEYITGIVARTDFPPAAGRLPVIGDVQSVNLEAVLAQKPDLIVTWPYTMPAQVAKLRARGIPVFTTDPATIEGIADDIERIGLLAGTGQTASAAAAALRKRIEALRGSSAGKPVLKVFYQIWDAPLFTLGEKHLITQALELCGGRNVFASLAMPAPQVSVEAVLAAQPDAIIAGADGALRPSWLDAWRRWPQLDAVRYGNLDVVDADLLHRPGPRFIDGVAALCATLDRERERRSRAAR